MNDGIRIRFSIGLIFVAVIHALLLGVVFNALHSRSPLQPTEKPWSICSLSKRGTDHDQD